MCMSLQAEVDDGALYLYISLYVVSECYALTMHSRPSARDHIYSDQRKRIVARSVARMG